MLSRLFPFPTPATRRLAVLFAVVYFAQGMWGLPEQPISIALKERGLTAGQVATFFAVSAVAWLAKPVYGIVSDLFPLWGRRRKSYVLLSSGLTAAAGLSLALWAPHTYGWLLAFYTLMGFGLAFTDVMADALMVERGQAEGLTGPFQSVQWASIYTAAMLAGAGGGWLTERRDLGSAFLLAGLFPLVTFTLMWLGIREPRVAPDVTAVRDTLEAVRQALRDRTLWLVAGLTLFWNFTPSLGAALLYYQTDLLGFRQQTIGNLHALGSASAVVGALAYGPIARRVPLTRMIPLVIGLGVTGTLAYLFYRSLWTAVLITGTFGAVSMFIDLAFLDLAARACPLRAEATFFALLMAVHNVGLQGSQVLGGHLYDWLGYVPLVLVSAATSALTWLIVPLVPLRVIEVRALGPAGR